MDDKRYPTDLSDEEWRCIRPYLPEHTGQGRPRLHGLRTILEAVFYVLKSGCPWRLLPRDFPPWKTVYHWFRKWRIDGTFERLNAALRERLRTRLGRKSQPDSQSAKTTGVGAANRGGTTAARRSVAGGDTSSWIQKGWSSKPRFTVLRCLTRTGASCCWRALASTFRVSPICGWMQVT